MLAMGKILIINKIVKPLIIESEVIDFIKNNQAWGRGVFTCLHINGLYNNVHLGKCKKYKKGSGTTFPVFELVYLKWTLQG